MSKLSISYSYTVVRNNKIRNDYKWPPLNTRNYDLNNYDTVFTLRQNFFLVNDQISILQDHDHAPRDIFLHFFYYFFLLHAEIGYERVCISLIPKLNGFYALILEP